MAGSDQDRTLEGLTLHILRRDLKRDPKGELRELQGELQEMRIKMRRLQKQHHRVWQLDPWPFCSGA